LPEKKEAAPAISLGKSPLFQRLPLRVPGIIFIDFLNDFSYLQLSSSSIPITPTYYSFLLNFFCFTNHGAFRKKKVLPEMRRLTDGAALPSDGGRTHIQHRSISNACRPPK
jgi:hypothetical protein